jgi:outer membrane protein insertion porin family
VPGTQLQRYSVTFREPFLFDSPYSLTTGGYFYTRQFDEYDERRLGGRVTIGRKLNQFWSVSAGARIENVDVRNVLPFAPAPIQDAKGNNFLLALRAGVTRDSRDSFMRPTEGACSASRSAGFRRLHLPGGQRRGNKYFTLWQRPDGSNRHVLAARSQFRWAGMIPGVRAFYAAVSEHARLPVPRRPSASSGSRSAGSSCASSLGISFRSGPTIRCL